MVEYPQTHQPQGRCCSYCQAPLPNHSPDSHCTALACRLKYNQQQISQVRVHKAALHQQMEQQKSRITQQWQQNNPGAPVTTVEIPNSNRKLVPPNRERIEAFVEHLQALVASLDQGPEDTIFASPQNTPPHQALAPQLASLCATCRGWCCHQGDKYFAFIQRSTLLQTLQRFSDMTPEELVPAYLQYLPDASVSNSCFFHGEKGCSLPADMRARICGEFFCTALDDFVKQQQTELVGTTLGFSTSDHNIIAVTVIDADGNLENLHPQN